MTTGKLVFFTGFLMLALSACTPNTQDYAGKPVSEGLLERSLKEKLDDQAIRNSVQQGIKSTKGLEAANIRVYCFARTIYLFGQTQNIAQLDAAYNAGRKVKEAHDVRNFLVLDDAVSRSRALRDTALKTRVEKKLAEERKLPLEHIQVAASNAEIYLFGYATKQQAKRATELARSVKGAETIVQLFKFSY